MKRLYKLLSVIIVSIILLSCKSQKVGCGYSRIYDSVTKMKVYEFVDGFPDFPGGNILFLQYISRNYHQSEGDIQGSCTLTFVVDKAGKIKGVRIFKKRKEEYTDEDKRMIKVFESMPAWKPGMCKGKKVDVMLTRKIHIHLK